jgi:hypothetical protein
LRAVEKLEWAVAKIGPDGLDREIWTKSGPSLDCAWTVFSKMVAEITMACKVKVRKKVT